MGERVMIADLKKYAVSIYTMSNGVEGWEEEEVYAPDPSTAWRKVYRRWGAATVPKLDRVREIKQEKVG